MRVFRSDFGTKYKTGEVFSISVYMYVYDVEHRTSFPRMTLSTAEVTYAIN